MEDVNFIDYVKTVSGQEMEGRFSPFLRNRMTSKGGPDGGDGGHGGHIILGAMISFGHCCISNIASILWRAMGGRKRQPEKGADGESIILEVPLGTVAKIQKVVMLSSIMEHGQELILLPGGKGGLGNVHFKTSTRQAQDMLSPYTGQESWKILELKVLADVGLVGNPNAGKSTFLSMVSAAKPKIADYPFTTLKPNLGIVSYRDFKSFTIADIPGIIEGAHVGKGHGHRFLKHIERNASLLLMIPADSDDIMQEYNMLIEELGAFNEELLLKKDAIGYYKVRSIRSRIEG